MGPGDAHLVEKRNREPCEEKKSVKIGQFFVLFRVASSAGARRGNVRSDGKTARHKLVVLTGHFLKNLTFGQILPCLDSPLQPPPFPHFGTIFRFWNSGNSRYPGD